MELSIDHIIVEPSDQIKIELRLQWHIFTLADQGGGVASLAIYFLAYF